MGLIDDFFSTIGGLFRALKESTGFDLYDPERSDENKVANKGIEKAAGVVGEAFAGTFDTTEDAILEQLDDEGPLTPENVEDVLNDAEGVAFAEVVAGLTATLGAEVASGGSLESHEVIAGQLLGTLILDDVLGSRTQAEFEQGVMPALEADAAKEHRSQFVSLQDAVEYALRNKDVDEGYLRASGASADVQDKIGSNEPVNPENLLEEWGIRDDQLPILEEVGLEAMEFEELIETPAELGLIVPDDLLDDVLDLAGYPEELKDFLRQVPREIPRSNRAWQERTTAEALVSKLDTLAANGELDPDEAEVLLPNEVDVAAEALKDRWRLLDNVSAGAPSASKITDSFTRGYTTRREYTSRLDDQDYNTDAYEDVLKAQILNELDGDLQESLALGLISETRYTDLCAYVGLDRDATDALLSGQSFSDITKAQLKESRAPAEIPVGSIRGIGEARSTALRAEEIETVADLAGVDVETVAEATDVSPETAEEWIQQARELGV